MAQTLQPKQPMSQQPPSAPQKPAPVPAREKKRPQKQKITFPRVDWLLVLAVIVVILQGALLFLLYKTTQEYRMSKKEDADQIYIIQKASTVAQKDISEIEKAFVGEDEVVAFIQNLETARASFDEFDLSFTSDVPQGKDNHYYSLLLSAVGRKETVLMFIDKLLHSTYALDVRDINLATNAEDFSKLDISLNADIYISPKKK